jgi:hypothetical protein
MKKKIFLNYRRTDTKQLAGRIFDRLRVAFPQFTIFMDYEEIPIGENFKTYISDTLKDTSLTLVIVGPTWAHTTKGIWPFQKKRLFDPNDYVRIEIELSISNKIKIVPILVEGATPSSLTNLPISIKDLKDYQAYTLNTAEFRRDVEELVRQLSSALNLHRVEDEVVPRLERVFAKKRFRAGCIKHPPLCNFDWTTKDSAMFSGLYVEICKTVASNTGLDVEFVPVDWGDIPNRVFNDMDLDLVLSVFQTPERAHVNAFTALFHKVNIVGLVKKDNDSIQTPEDIRNGSAPVVVTRGEAGWEFAIQTLGLPRNRLLVVESYDLGTMMKFVESGTAAIAICDEVTCAEFEDSSGHVKRVFTSDPLDTCKNGIMVPANEDAWRSWVGNEFRKARDSAHIKGLEEEILSRPGQVIKRYS